MRRLLNTFAVLALLLVASAAPASAHAELLSSDPADGSTLQAAPAQVTLEFSEVLLEETVDVAIQGPSGAVSSAVVEAAGASVVIPWPADAGTGDFQVNFRVVSADGHPVEGSVAFAIAADEAVSAGSAASPAPAQPEASAEATPISAEVTATGAAADEPVNWPFVIVIMLLGIVGFTALLIASRSAREKRRG